MVKNLKILYSCRLISSMVRLTQVRLQQCSNSIFYLLLKNSDNLLSVKLMWSTEIKFFNDIVLHLILHFEFKNFSLIIVIILFTLLIITLKLN